MMNERGRRGVKRVTRQRSFSLFLVCTLTAIILGLSIRIFFSETRIREWAHTGLRDPNFKFQFQTASLSLADGWIPHFAIRVDQLGVQSEKNCGSESAIVADTVYLPLSFSRLINGQIRLGVVTGASLTVRIDSFKENCERNDQKKYTGPSVVEDAIHPGDPASKSVAKIAVEQVPMIHAEKKDLSAGAKTWVSKKQWESGLNFFEGAEFRRIDIIMGGGAQQVSLEKFKLRQEQDESGRFFNFQTTVRLPSDVLFGENLSSFKIKGKLSENQLEAEMKGNLSEGMVLSHLHLVPTDVEPEAQLKLDLKSIPVSTISPILLKAKLITEKVHPQFLWLNCHGEIQGSLRNLFKINPLNISDCSFEGESGHAKVEAATRFANGEWSPFHVEIRGIQLQKLFDMLTLEAPTGVLSQLGVFSGGLDFRSSDDVTLAGSISGVEVFFSNHNVRGRQLIEALRLQIEKKGAQVLAKVESLVLKNGAIDGKIEARLSEKLDSGEIRVALDRIELDADVEKLMLNGRGEGLSLHGTGLIRGHHLSEWQGDVKLSRLEGDGFWVSKMFLKTDFRDDEFKISARAEEGQLLPFSKAWQVMAPLFFNHQIGDSGVSLKEMAAQVNVLKDQVEWSKLRLSLDRGKVTVLSQGNWKPGPQWSGVAIVAFPKVKRVSWVLGGKELWPSVALDERDQTKFGDATDRSVGWLSNVSPVEHSSLGDKVMARARAILPGLKSESKAPAKGAQAPREEPVKPSSARPGDEPGASGKKQEDSAPASETKALEDL